MTALPLIWIISGFRISNPAFLSSGIQLTTASARIAFQDINRAGCAKLDATHLRSPTRSNDS